MTRFEFERFLFKKKFNTRGLPLAKKMWRDGYNKALDDIYKEFLIEDTVFIKRGE